MEAYCFVSRYLLHKDEIAAKWLFYSLYQYAASERFVPEQTMEPGQIEKM